MVGTIIELIVLVPAIGALAWALLWLWKRAQASFPAHATTARPVQIIDSIPFGAGTKLVVIRFNGVDLLVATTRSGLTVLRAEERVAPHA